MHVCAWFFHIGMSLRFRIAIVVLFLFPSTSHFITQSMRPSPFLVVHKSVLLTGSSIRTEEGVMQGQLVILGRDSEWWGIVGIAPSQCVVALELLLYAYRLRIQETWAGTKKNFP